ncbi:MAG: hypothetical protein ACI9GM_000905 [Salibacteraceae bacterium]
MNRPHILSARRASLMKTIIQGRFGDKVNQKKEGVKVSEKLIFLLIDKVILGFYCKNEVQKIKRWLLYVLG